MILQCVSAVVTLHGLCVAGARWTGLALMKAAQHGHEGFGGGNQFFAELSSVNPVVMCVHAQTARSSGAHASLIQSGVLRIGCRVRSRSGWRRSLTNTLKASCSALGSSARTRAW